MQVKPTTITKHDRKTAPSAESYVWSIGIYAGISPFKLLPHPKITNPILSRDDVSDVPAAFVADPFMLRVNGSWYMFFEVMNAQSNKGEIGLAVSADGLNWRYSQIVLTEAFHLSYPYVFEWQGDYYMIPETLEPGAVRLYKANSFPFGWSFVRTLIEGQCADPSIFHFQDRWWLFSCATPYQHDTLRLHFAEDLLGPWLDHPCNPIIEGNPGIARPAGRVLVFDEKVIRFAQDCHRSYGRSVRAFEITTLTKTEYREQEIAESPILRASGRNWNASGMHTVDAHLTRPGSWLACVDGLTRK
jgi:hypothetical protein